MWNLEFNNLLAAIEYYVQIATVEGVIIQLFPVLHMRLGLFMSVPDINLRNLLLM
jgi:hypothetical protein